MWVELTAASGGRRLVNTANVLHIGERYSVTLRNQLVRYLAFAHSHDGFGGVMEVLESFDDISCVLRVANPPNAEAAVNLVWGKVTDAPND